MDNGTEYSKKVHFLKKMVSLCANLTKPTKKRKIEHF